MHKSDYEWLSENSNIFNDIDIYAFAERVSIKIESGISVSDARRQALFELEKSMIDSNCEQ